MRKFRLLSYDETKSFSLFGGSIVVTDVTGLGTKLSLVKSEGSDRYYISDVYTEFDDITFVIYFGVNGNTYTDYNNLMSFIAVNGKRKLVLEYDILGTTKYCDVWLTEAPKTQKDTTNTMNATFVFSRLSHWYTKLNIGFSLQTEYREVAFPLDIPIPFSGSMSVEDVILKNTFFEEYHLDITITGPLDHDLAITLENIHGIVQNKVIVKKRLLEGEWFRINGETKKITYYDSEQILTLNGYNYVDHNHDSFITVPTGTHTLSVALDAGDTCQVIISYKQLVLD